MVDLDTFLKRFKEFKSADIIVRNNWDVEEAVLSKFGEWVRVNMTPDEVFTLLDFDCDGLVNATDFKRCCLEQLNFSQCDVSHSILERVMQRISLTKNRNIGLADIKEFMNKKKASEFVNLTYTNSNLNKNLSSQAWVNEAIIRLGLYVSENYLNIQQFFETYSDGNKLRIENFKTFLAKEHKCFEGFKLTSDEIVTVYSALDPHKKNFVTLEDLVNKLANFDFYRKMHLDLKNFIKSNFKSSEDAFNYFKSDFKDNEENNILSKKEIFDGISNTFPNKFQTETILRYITKKFKLIDNKISFTEFNFVYFDEIRNKNDPLMESTSSFNRITSANYNKKNNTISKPVRANSARPQNRVIPSAFDDEPLEKIKRIINTSRFDYANYFKMHELISDKGLVNQFEFRNMLKKLNLGLTNLEIDQILLRAGKTWDGKINIKEFYKFITTE